MHQHHGRNQKDSLLLALALFFLSRSCVYPLLEQRGTPAPYLGTELVTAAGILSCDVRVERSVKT
jgi:hypothetical protein